MKLGRAATASQLPTFAWIVLSMADMSALIAGHSPSSSANDAKRLSKRRCAALPCPSSVTATRPCV